MKRRMTSNKDWKLKRADYQQLACFGHYDLRTSFEDTILIVADFIRRVLFIKVHHEVARCMDGSALGNIRARCFPP